LSRTNKN